MNIPTHPTQAPPDWEGLEITADFYTGDDEPTTLPVHVSFDHMQPGFDFHIGDNITFTITLTDLAKVIVAGAPEYQK